VGRKASFAYKSPNTWALPTPDRAARPVPRKGMIPLTSNGSTTFVVNKNFTVSLLATSLQSNFTFALAKISLVLGVVQN
jgi:hypothetical protein